MASPLQSYGIRERSLSVSVCPECGTSVADNCLFCSTCGVFQGSLATVSMVRELEEEAPSFRAGLVALVQHLKQLARIIQRRSAVAETILMWFAITLVALFVFATVRGHPIYRRADENKFTLAISKIVRTVESNFSFKSPVERAAGNHTPQTTAILNRSTRKKARQTAATLKREVGSRVSPSPQLSPLQPSLSSATPSPRSFWDAIREPFIPISEPEKPQKQVRQPQLTVWVDMRTGLYYCPGADYYGGNRKGKYMLQRDAQLDHFEPALRRPCK